MPKGISLHIGLNFVDPDHYDGWDGELVACEADARDMQALAKSCGFKPDILLRQDATVSAVKKAIGDAAKSLKSGDIFFLTYSGHGGQVNDLNADEGRFGDTHDRKDETWCLYDREFVDDELAALYAQFKKGVRILVLSDSCHSGTVTRAIRRKPRGRVRLMPRETAERVYLKHKALYDAIQRGLKGTEDEDQQARVLLISGCLDNQLSLDGDENGLFTGTLKAVWQSGDFSGGYREFRDAIAVLMPEDQTPNYFPTGPVIAGFEEQTPFTIDAPNGKAKKGRAKKTLAKAKTKPIDVVIAALNDMGYNDPRDGGGAVSDSDLTGFFRRVKIEDGKLDVPGPGRLAGFVAVLSERLGIQVSIKQLLNDDYSTPRDLARLA